MKTLSAVLIISSGVVLTVCNNGDSGSSPSGSSSKTDENNIANSVVRKLAPSFKTVFLLLLWIGF